MGGNGIVKIEAFSKYFISVFQTNENRENIWIWMEWNKVMGDGVGNDDDAGGEACRVVVDKHFLCIQLFPWFFLSFYF